MSVSCPVPSCCTDQCSASMSFNVWTKVKSQRRMGSNSRRKQRNREREMLLQQQCKQVRWKGAFQFFIRLGVDFLSLLLFLLICSSTKVLCASISVWKIKGFQGVSFHAEYRQNIAQSDKTNDVYKQNIIQLGNKLSKILTFIFLVLQCEEVFEFLSGRV